MYDPSIGRWGVVDNKAELLESSSPYVYSLNSPMIYIDRDGELPILINGRVASDAERGKKKYWDAQLLATIKSSGIPNSGREPHFVDGDRYATNFYGKNFIQEGHNYESGANSSSQRHVAGYEVGKEDFAKILAKLERDPQSGKIIEKIQIYTHSRGAAFGSGYTEALLEMIAKNSSLFADPSNVIDFVLNIAPHQSNSITTPRGVKGYSIDHTWDILSGNDMGNSTTFKTNTAALKPGLSHKNKSFSREVGAFVKAYSDSKGENKKLIDDFIEKMRSYGISVTIN